MGEEKQPTQLVIGEDQMKAMLALIANKGVKPRTPPVQEEATVSGNKNKAYKLQPSAADRVHALLIRKEFSRETGKPLFEPFVAIFEPRVEWKQFLAHKQGLSIKEVLHLPKGAITVESFEKDAAAKLQAERKKLGMSDK